jgi:hypothetical protein
MLPRRCSCRRPRPQWQCCRRQTARRSCLVTGNHHRREILIDVAGRSDLHTDQHFRHRASVLRKERYLMGQGRTERRRTDRSNVLSQRGCSGSAAKAAVTATTAAATVTEPRLSRERMKGTMAAPAYSCLCPWPYSNPSIDTLAVVISVGHRISVRPFATAIFCIPLTK